MHWDHWQKAIKCLKCLWACRMELSGCGPSRSPSRAAKVAASSSAAALAFLSPFLFPLLASWNQTIESVSEHVYSHLAQMTSFAFSHPTWPASLCLTTSSTRELVSSCSSTFWFQKGVLNTNKRGFKSLWCLKYIACPDIIIHIWNDLYTNYVRNLFLVFLI